MGSAVRTLRAVQWAMLGSILLYAALGVLIHAMARNLDPASSYLFTTLGVAIVGVIFVVRRTLVFRAEEILTTQPDNKVALNQWKTGYIATYSLCEALALFGLVQRFMGGSVQQSLPYYIGGFVLLFFFRPRQPELAIATPTLPTT
jgi:hypothetical protein